VRTAKRKTGSTGRSPAPDLAWQQGVEARFASDGRKIAARDRQIRRSRAALQETVKELSAENERLRSRLAAAEACMLGEPPPGRIARAVRDLGLAVGEFVASLEQAK
jgi:hypothetical protein